VNVLVLADDQQTFCYIEAVLKQGIPGLNVGSGKLDRQQLVKGNGDRLAAMIIDLDCREFGPALVKEIRHISAVPILLVADINSNQTRLLAGLDAGASDYILKPLQKNELLQRFSAIVREIKPCCS
jgi:DNA-binding response OmpR family regulator